MEITRVYENIRYHVSLTPEEARAIANLTASSEPVLANLAIWLSKMGV